MAPPSPTAPRAATVPWVLLGLDGRIGRQAYWLSFLLTIALMSIAFTPYRGSLPEGPDLYFLLLAGLGLWMQVALVTKRLHDRGMSGLFALLQLVPIVNVGMLIFVGLMPGDPGPNRFGPHTDGRGRFG
jgi:uncharacterized membrane protein YhaH (DUF805 family)